MTAPPFDPSHLPRRSRRGFAGMDPARLREIARDGGRAAHAQGAAHEFNSEEARLAGLRSQSLRLAARETHSTPARSR